MLPTSDPDRIDIAFDDHRLVADAGLLLPATLAGQLGLQELADSCVDLGDAPGRAVTGKLDIREVASSLPNEEGADDWLESAPLADSLDDDDHVSEEPAECSAIESEVTA